MAYEERAIARQKIRYNNANTDRPLEYQLVVDGEKVTTAPDSAPTISIYRNGSDTALVSGASMTVSGSKYTYAVDTTTTANFPTGSYRAEITILFSPTTYKRHLFFDVVPYVFEVNIGFDQLVALDDGIRGMQHDFDSQMGSLIEACNAILQVRLEAKVVKDKKLMTDMIIDSSSIATVQRFYILYRLWKNKGNEEKAEGYKEEYEALLDAVLSSIRYDTGLEGDEPVEEGGLDETRFTT